MEVLDQFFGNVCELDLVFNFYKVGASPRDKSKHWQVADALNRFMQFWTKSSWPARFKRRQNK